MLNYTVYYGILSCFLLTQMQYTAQDVSDNITQAIKGELSVLHKNTNSLSLTTTKPLTISVVHSEIDNQDECQFQCDDIEESYKIDLHDPILQKCDSDIIIRWMSLAWLVRIEMNAKSLQVPIYTVFYNVVQIDDTLQKNKHDMKEALFNHALSKINCHDAYTPTMKMQLLMNMQLDIDNIKQRLWLQHMHEACDFIYQDVAKNKNSISYCVWPYIREIHSIKNFPTMYNDHRDEKL